AALRTLRDRVPVELAAHLSAELPILIRGAFYDQYQPTMQPVPIRTVDEFLQVISLRLEGVIIEADVAAEAVLGTLTAHIPQGMVEKMMAALPHALRDFWRQAAVGIEPAPNQGPHREARTFEQNAEADTPAAGDDVTGDGEPAAGRPAP